MRVVRDALAFGGAVRTDIQFVDGFRGTQEIRTNPPAVASVTYAHPFQVHFPNGRFFAVGTYKGAAVAGCSAQMAGRWSAYTGGVKANGDYFCTTEKVDAFGVGAKPSLRLAHAACGAQGGWGAYLDGERVSCRAAWATTTAISVGVALETAAPAGTIPADRNIDVIHRELEFHSAYLDVWAPMAPNARRVDPRYVVEVPGPRRVRSFLGVLD
ncbi:hypothetical protein GUY44_24025 [Pimelobacter simplex]|uniref:hypothetical protein n=1 Tax=Nocardioides simplex TaxID=2045 RepID=UPI0008E59982|nr:hypothetical protein [Pimelobacter simplex]MCG8153568.1 hypothetical protein [Pimelobacter simplex]SFN10492.1 hypothetical protein SAMN05421671_5172 [Pimelobacter simplex]